MRYCLCGNPLGDTLGNKCAECTSTILDKILANKKSRPTKRAADVAETSAMMKKIEKEIASAGGVPPKYWQRR